MTSLLRWVMGRSVTSFAVGFCIVLATALPSYATPVTYTDEAAFHADLGNLPMEIESFETSYGVDPLMFPSVTVRCAVPEDCEGSFGTSTLLPTDGEQGVEFSSPNTITMTWDRPIIAFGFDLRDLGTSGPTDLILILKGETIYVLRGYTGAPGGKVFVGVIDYDGIDSARFKATNDSDGAYVDRLQTMPQGYAIFGGERAPDFDEVQQQVDDAAVAPEPGALWLMLMGLSVLGVGSRIRRC